ncbi:MAG: universal stress protein [Geitlerinemataceae cyanobacterium]
MFQKVLICTDFKDGLLRFANCLESFVQSGIREIVFFHSVPLWTEGDIPRVDDEKVAAARARFDTALANVPDGLSVKYEIRSDRPIDSICAVVKENDCELAILGSQGRTLLNEKLFGSTSTKLTQKLPIPMLVIRPAMVAAFTNEELELRCRSLFRRLLVAYDASEPSDALVDTLLARFCQPGDTAVDRCKLGWVIETTRRASVDEKIEQARETIEAAGQRFADTGLAIETEVRTGDPIAEIVKMASESGVSAIAVTAHSLPAFLEWSRPSFPKQLLRSSLHPVLFFPPKS